MTRILGIDYGEKRVGVALSDDAGVAAYPRTVLPNNDGLMRAITELAASEGVERIVIGAAENPAGGENANAVRARHFSDALRVASGLLVELVPEAFSSAEARRPFAPMPGERPERGPVVDAAAAAIILQSYLDHHQRADAAK